ncbi:MAG TPA: HAD-IA family hydrolase [Gemmatales bacterium]|nr:HAD-IA family hydrolase [Gemmatales bacterium]HMP58501.1 HAD-IA family hydrolase [Gemmatales bacterium]
MTAPITGLLLDLDGTIVNTLGFLFEAFRHALQPYVTRLPSDAEVVATFGPSEPECLARYLRQAEAAGQATQPAAAVADRAADRFFAYYENGLDQVRTFPGIVELITVVRQQGRRVGVFTGKGRRGAEYTLDQIGLMPGPVEFLVSSDDVIHPKPHPEGVLRSLELLSTPAADTLFVGDAPADILAGKAAGVRTAAAVWGCFNPTELLATEPDHVCRNVADLALILGIEPASTLA